MKRHRFLRRRCPSARALSRAFPQAEPALELHLEDCPRCAAEWQALAALVAVGRELPVTEPRAERREAVRTSLLVAAEVDRPGRGGRGPAVAVARGWRWAALAAAALVAVWIGAGMLAPGGGGAARSGEVRRAAVQASAGADFVHTRTPATAAAPADEVVRLSRGRVTVDVARLERGERFRVVTGDAEVEVRGTAFEVLVVDDRLAAVTVHHGLVEVRPAGRPAVLLGAGEVWGEEGAGKLAREGGQGERDEGGEGLERDVGVGGDEGVGEGDEEVTRSGPSTPTPALPLRGRGTGIEPGGSTRVGAGSSTRVGPSTPTPALPLRGRGTGGGPSVQATAESAEASVEPTAGAATEAREATEARAEAEAAAGAAAEARAEPAEALVEPTAAEVAFQRGWRATRAKRWTEAARAFEAAVALAPEGPLAEDARYHRAVALGRAGASAPARAAMGEYLRRHGGSDRAGEIAVMLGWILVEDGAIGEAEAAFRRAASDPRPEVRTSARQGLERVRASRR